MSESPKVVSFSRVAELRAATIRLALVQEYGQSFERLADLYQNVTRESMMWCCAMGHWKLVLGFADGLQRFLHWQGHWAEAMRMIGYALEAATRLPDVMAYANYMLYAGVIQAEQGDYGSANLYYRYSLGIAERGEQAHIQGEVWRRLGWLAHIQGQREPARAHYQRALDLHCQAKDRLGQARDQRQLAILAIECGDWIQAECGLRSCLDAVDGQVDMESQQLQAGAWLDLGRIALQRGQLDDAGSHFDRALQCIERVPDLLLDADIHFHVALLAELRGNSEQAKAWYEERKRLVRVGDRQGKSSAWIGLGNMVMKQMLGRSGERAKEGYLWAQECYERALKYADIGNRAVAQAQLGTLAYLRGDYELARDRIEQARGVFEKLGRQGKEADCHHQLGLVAQTTGQWRTAQEHYETSLAIRRRLGLRHKVVESLYQLGTLAQQQREYAEARSYYRHALCEGEQAGFPNLDQIRLALNRLL